MLSYNHRYHAGNFADIHKHVALVNILSHLSKKEAPFCVLDAYAGEGWYDLNANEIQKNKEYLKGYAQYKQKLNDCSDVSTPNLIEIAEYYQSLHKLPAIYPGSPAIIAHALRSQDRAIFIEQHPQAYLELKRKLSNSKQGGLHVMQMDALQAMKAYLPFKEGRGLIFIDPSYEIKADYLSVASTLYQVYSKFAQGIYVIWYPILNAGNHQKLVKSILSLDYKIKPTFWHSEWIPDPSVEEGLIGSGLIVINPPWQFAQSMQSSLFNSSSF